MKAMRVGLVLAALTLVALPAAAADAPKVPAAAAPKVISVLSVRVKGDYTAYLQRVKQFGTVQKRLETGGTMRLWRATAAGPNVGTISVVIEYANLEAFAKAQTKLQADEEWSKLRGELDASGLRDVIDASLFVEITP